MRLRSRPSRRHAGRAGGETTRTGDGDHGWHAGSGLPSGGHAHIGDRRIFIRDARTWTTPASAPTACAWRWPSRSSTRSSSRAPSWCATCRATGAQRPALRHRRRRCPATDFRYATAVAHLREVWNVQIVDTNLVASLADRFGDLFPARRVGRLRVGPRLAPRLRAAGNGRRGGRPAPRADASGPSRPCGRSRAPTSSTGSPAARPSPTRSTSGSPTRGSAAATSARSPGRSPSASASSAPTARRSGPIVASASQGALPHGEPRATSSRARHAGRVDSAGWSRATHPTAPAPSRAARGRRDGGGLRARAAGRGGRAGAGRPGPRAGTWTRRRAHHRRGRLR